jgi:antitoxin component YwqK of YwqJK toxin-antitoxin module
MIKDKVFYKSYFSDGQLWTEVNYINNKMNGIFKSYHYNGCELTNVNSKRENLSSTNFLGQIIIEVNYIDGLKQGIYKLYYENGQIIIEVNYIDDERQGIYKSYHRNGQLEVERNYIDDKMDKYVKK